MAGTSNRALTGASLSMLATLICTATAHAQTQATDRDIIVNGLLPSADDTYRTQTIEVGPLGDKTLRDTP